MPANADQVPIAAPLPLEGRTKDSQRSRYQASCTKSLNHPRSDEFAGGGRNRAADAAQREDRDTQDEDAPVAKVVAQGAAHQDQSRQ